MSACHESQQTPCKQLAGCLESLIVGLYLFLLFSLSSCLTMDKFHMHVNSPVNVIHISNYIFKTDFYVLEVVVIVGWLVVGGVT